MQESMNVAKTLALKMVKDIEKKVEWGIHIHCPSGATPKDGPSAGVAITVALISLFTNLPIRNNIGVTGEIDLQGNVLTIGGLESKIDGAKTAGCDLVMCPYTNIEDLNKIRNQKTPPEDDTFKVKLIKTIYEALDEFLILPEDKKLSDYIRGKP
jgi:ATP-dependent Lon protease